jgi:hypothetical protein
MTSRRGDSQGGVLSFTYLDVLVCTMGSLVLMLVMFSEKAKRAALAEAEKRDPPAAVATAAIEATPPADADKLARQLSDLRRRQANLEQARAQAQEQLRDEQQRLSHLEEHQRRLEHDLAKLHITLKQLESTEEQQVVDQDQAEKELERLRQLIKDTEARLADMREEDAGQRSYAIVPYKGPNGTFRRPVYVECTREAIIVQPEGIRLTADDFGMPLGSGNPLAAAIRAAQEELNARARAGGATDLPDPYPLFIVRPDGIKAYEVALAATRTWDSDYGYEFVDADWKLTFPEADPRLAQIMTHAIDTARERQRLLAMAAPSRYGTRLTGAAGPGPGRGPGGGGSGAGGYGATVQQAGAFDDRGSNPSGGGDSGTFAENVAASPAMTGNSMAGGDRYSQTGAGSTAAGAGSFAGETAPDVGAAGVEGGAAASPTPGATAVAGAPGAPASGNAPGSSTGSRPTQSPSGFDTAGAGYSSTTGTPSPGQFDPHAPPAPANNVSVQRSVAMAGGRQVDETNNAGAAANVDDADSAARTRGVNWANKAANRRASPINRPIHLIVRPDQLTLIDTNAVPDPAALQGKVVSFHQPGEKVLDQLAAAIREQTRDWGLAGHGMYWRPTLVFQVAPGAERHAQRLAALMEDSGVDVKLPAAVTPRSAEGSAPPYPAPQTAARPEDPNRATR